MEKPAKFFNPKRVDAEDPKICNCIPLKYIVVVYQMLIIAVFATLFIDIIGFWKWALNAAIFVFLIASFFGFVYEYKPIMEAHLLWSALTTVLIVCGLVYQTIMMVIATPEGVPATMETILVNSTVEAVVNSTTVEAVTLAVTENVTQVVVTPTIYNTYTNKLFIGPFQVITCTDIASFVLLGIVLTAIQSVYTWMCYELVRAVERKNSTLGVVRGAAHQVLSEAQDLLEAKR